jgi:hypothetical protein
MYKSFDSQTSINNQEAAQILGSFSFLSFMKSVLVPVKDAHFLFTQSMHSMSMDEIDISSQKLFNQLSEVEKQNQILFEATDLHETHHFHSFILLPAGRVVFELHNEFILNNQNIFPLLRERINQKIEPFSVPIEVTINQHIFRYLRYYLGNELPQGEVVGKLNTNPFVYRYQYGPKDNPSFLPVVKINKDIYPLGLTPLLESWTEALIKTLVHRLHTQERYNWYCNTKRGKVFWQYNLVKWILQAIFDSSFDRLEPREQSMLISFLVINSATIDTTFTSDFFQRTNTHPGWQFAQLIEVLWISKASLLSDNLLDFDKVFRFVNRLIFLEEKETNKQQYTILDNYLNVFLIQNQNNYLDFPLLSTIYTQYNNFQGFVNRIFSINPFSYICPKEWLNLLRRDVIPRIPLMIARRENSRPHLAFPSESNNSIWFVWFLFTKVLESLMNGKPQCPIHYYNLETGCSIDHSCNNLTNIIAKKESCYLYQLINSNWFDPSSRSE